MIYLPPLALPHRIDILTINNVIVNKQTKNALFTIGRQIHERWFMSNVILNNT